MAFALKVGQYSLLGREKILCLFMEHCAVREGEVSLLLQKYYYGENDMSKKLIERISHRSREDIVNLPNLIELQIRSYEDFLQVNSLPNMRKRMGLEEVFQEICPIKSYDERVVMEYLSYSLGAPRHTPEECIRRGVTYNVILRVTFRLTDTTGIKEEEVYMGTVPIMTDKGTFIINGVERVIISQLHRSPGICFERMIDLKRRSFYSFRIIPYRGSWLEAVFDPSGHIWIYIDRKKRRRKVLATSFIRTLGYSSNADILEEFFDTRKVRIQSERDFSKALGCILAEDLIDEERETIYGKVGEKLTTAMLKRILDRGIQVIRIVEDVVESHPIIRMLEKDPTDSYESALKDLYRKIRPGEPATLSSARSIMMRLFFDPKRYNLGKVGRYKINRKLGMPVTEEELEIVTLKREDVIFALKYLIRLQMGESGVSIDDIDHLGNRRVRCVGELVKNQCRIGLARMEKVIRERMNLFDFSGDTLTPGKVISIRAIGILKEFFSRSQLSQFMDQLNPIAELTHKRRLSSLGPGGLNRERAGSEVRDVHSSHYGRICPVETPEGQNIGLITSLSCFAKVNEFGFIETPYRKVEDGIVTDEIEYMTADQEEHCVIAQASSSLTEQNTFAEESCWCRYGGEVLCTSTDRVQYMDVSPKQVVSIVTGLIPFLEHDDAHRALMGANMQRQAVPLLQPEAPIVGTGLERRAARDSGAVVLAEENGVITYADGARIVLKPENSHLDEREYRLKSFLRSNSGTCLNQHPVCQVGDRVLSGDVLADGTATDRGEIALGRNVLVAFMSWEGYNYEDAIIVSEKLVREDYFTSIHIEQAEISERETKLGKEEITRDVPNVAEQALENLDEDGIVQVGSKVSPGDILVGKIMPKSETELSPEERLLRAIFGEKASDVKNVSLTASLGMEGFVMDVGDFRLRNRHTRVDYEVFEETQAIKKLKREYRDRKEELAVEKHEQLSALLLGSTLPGDIIHRKTADILLEKGTVMNEEQIKFLEKQNVNDLIFSSDPLLSALQEIFFAFQRKWEEMEANLKKNLDYLRKGNEEELDAGVMRKVKVYVATKRKLQVGDKMAGRHGNKGVVSKIVPEADMPYMEDGRTIEMILNPLGVPSRLNIGQLLETHLGIAAEGTYVEVPVFEGYPEEEIWKMMKKRGLPADGKFTLYDGCTGERFSSKVTVGFLYLLKLGHLVADKIHARAIGPYSLVTQQPLGGKAQYGGQRFGEMEVWALEAFGASHVLQEMLTVKSDDVKGRSRMYEEIVKGEGFLRAGVPESFQVLVRELNGLGFDVQMEPDIHEK